MVKNALAIVAAAALMLIAVSAQAQQPDYARTGVYIGAGVGPGFEAFDDFFDLLDFDTGFVVDGWLGYRVHPNIAIEAQLEYSRYESDAIGPFDLDLNLLTFTTNLKCYVATGQIQPFALVGIGVMNAELDIDGPGFDRTISESDLAARFGGGVDYWVTESISLGLTTSYILTTGDVEDLDYISLALGIQYRF